MCRNIRTLFNFEPPATDDEIRAASRPVRPQAERVPFALQGERGGVREGRDRGLGHGAPTGRFAGDQRRAARPRGRSGQGQGASGQAFRHVGDLVDGAFFQDPPRLSNTFDADPLLRETLARLVPDSSRPLEVWRGLGEAAAGPLAVLAREAEVGASAPRPLRCVGTPVDAIEVSPAWTALQHEAARWGLAAAAYEADLGPLRARPPLRAAPSLRAQLRHLDLLPGHDRRRGADADRARARSRPARGSAPDQPRSRVLLDQRPVDDRAWRRQRRRRGHPHRGAPRRGRGLAAPRGQVVHVRHHQRDRAHARAGRGHRRADACSTSSSGCPTARATASRSTG